MKANYHNHTFRCKHASRTEEEYVRRAIDGGIEILGFSDHAPFYFVGDYVPASKMGMDEIDSYFDTLLSLKEKYKSYLDIKIGFEIEYYPKLWDRALEKYAQYPLDYLILGEHFIGNESISCVSAFERTTNENVLKSFVDHCINAVNTGKITYVCHPDNINFQGDEAIYVREMTRLINECKRLSVPLEINMLGMRTGRYYPRDLFWQTAGELGAEAVLGFDSHEPCHVANSREIENAIAYAERFNIRTLDKIELKNPLI